MQEKRHSLARGAATLAMANLLVKLIGVLYRVPLKNWLGGQGMAYYSVASRIFGMTFLLISAGVPVALSGLIARSRQLGRVQETRSIMRVSAALFLPPSAVLAFLLWNIALPLCRMFGSPDSCLAARCVAGAVMFAAVQSLFRGYYQGTRNLVPTALSQLAEAVGKILFGLGLAALALQKGRPLPEAAAAAALGITVGEGLGVLMLALYAARRKPLPLQLNDSRRPWPLIARALACAALPVMLSGAVSGLGDLIDLSLMMNRLRASGLSDASAETLYGVYNSMVVSLAYLPQTLIAALAVAAVPLLSGVRVAQADDRCRRLIGMIFRTGLVVACPCAVGFLTLSGPILNILFQSDLIAASALLRAMSMAVPWLAVSMLSTAVLQGLGHAARPLLSLLLGAAVKAGSEYFLLAQPKIGMLGAPLSTLLSTVVICMLNLFFIRKLVGPPLREAWSVLRPIGAAAGMGGFILVFRTFVPGGGRLATLGLIALSAGIYGVLLIGLRGVQRQDVLLLPGGARWLQQAVIVKQKKWKKKENG